MAVNTPKNPASVNKKNIYITFIVIGIIAWFPISTLMLNIFDLLSAWVPNIKVGMVQLHNVISIIICALIVYGLIRSKSVYEFTNEVYIELGKVSWPVKKGTGISYTEKFRELRESTLVVLISIVILAIVISLMDKIFEFVIRIIY